GSPRSSMPTSSSCWRKVGSSSTGATPICSPGTGCTAGCTTFSSGADVLSAFTLVRNAVKIDFPIVPAIRSVLEVCDEVVVNVGKSDDETRDLVASVNDPRVRILDAVWDFSIGNRMISAETQRAMDASRAGDQRETHHLADDLSLGQRAPGKRAAGRQAPRVDPPAAAVHGNASARGRRMDCAARARSGPRGRAAGIQARARTAVHF